ncbi:MAG: hypothetical protein H7Z13_11740 [Ferruginibacter sp.]|nr:hypothetical protein [Ferruginibacter sp.]
MDKTKEYSIEVKWGSFQIVASVLPIGGGDNAHGSHPWLRPTSQSQFEMHPSLVLFNAFLILSKENN